MSEPKKGQKATLQPGRSPVPLPPPPPPQRALEASFMTAEPPCELCENSPYRCVEHAEEW